jgi:hypothetical protein
MDKLTEASIRTKLPEPGKCMPACDRCGGQGWSHGSAPGPGSEVVTCPGPSAPMFTMGEMRDALWEIDALRDSLFEAERQLAMLRAGQ